MERKEMCSLMARFFEAMNAHDVDAMSRLCNKDIVSDEVAEPEPASGLKAFDQSYSELFKGYPDCTAEILKMNVDGNTVIAQIRWSGTNKGAFRGSEPTNKGVNIRIAYFVEVAGDRISRITEYYDLATVLSQQGQLNL